ncbi:MAG: type VI secretion system ATPase TssH, partial [Proteobacteria bacterium]|nr:type VI secretion system ATPase TssH [Pseudomonadota bacterium]
MKLDQLTVKAREAFASAREVAIARHHAEIGPEHLLFALLEQEGGVVPRILTKLGADAQIVRADLERSFGKLARVHGSALDADASRAFKDTWEAAGKAAGEMKDEFVSTEHFLLALAEGKHAAGEALRAAGATRATVL